MDIQAMSMDMAQSKVMDQVGAALLGKSLAGMKEEGAEIVKLMGAAAPLPELSGGAVDTYA